MGSIGTHGGERVMRRFAFLFPGQGAQIPGMGQDFYDAFPIAKQTFEEADERLGESFSRFIFEAPASELTMTNRAQLAIFIVSTAILRTVKEQFPALEPHVCAGLSLGEYTAVMAAGKISFGDALGLVRVRGDAMHEACGLEKGTMFVVLGLSEEAVAEALDSLREQRVWIANLNCPSQVVIAGAEREMPRAIEALKAKGAKKILPLDVAGAFHSQLMHSAQQKLGPRIEAAPFTNSQTQLVMNVPGDFVSELSLIRRYLFEQVVSPVRWERGMRAMDDTIDVYLEMGPGKSLSGMNKRIGVKGVTLSVEKVTDLESIVTQLEASCSC